MGGRPWNAVLAKLQCPQSGQSKLVLRRPRHHVCTLVRLHFGTSFKISKSKSFSQIRWQSRQTHIRHNAKWKHGNSDTAEHIISVNKMSVKNILNTKFLSRFQSHRYYVGGFTWFQYSRNLSISLRDTGRSQQNGQKDQRHALLLHRSKL